MGEKNNKKPHFPPGLIEPQDPEENQRFFRPDVVGGLVLVAVAIIFRVFFYLASGESEVFAKYTVLALELAKGTDLGVRLLDVSPFYLGLLWFMAEMSPGLLDAMPFIQLVVGVAVCLLVYAIGLRFFNRQVGFTAGFLYAMYGNGMVLESTMEPYVFVLLFNALAVYLLMRALDRQPASMALMGLAGFFSGLSVLAKPNFLLFILFACLWIHFALRARQDTKKANLYPILYVVISLLIIMPVTFRNYVKYNDFVLVTADYGKVFFHGNAGATTVFIPQYLPGQADAPPGEINVDYPHVYFREKASHIEGRQLSPSEAARFWTQYTVDDILKDPWRYLKLEGRKLALFFHNFEIHHIQANHYRYQRSLEYPFLRFGAIASLALLGMILGFRERKRLALIYGVVGVYLVSGLIFVVNSRYRGPAVPYLCLFGGMAFHYTAAYFVEKRTKALVGSLALLLGLMVLTHFTYGEEIREYMGIVLQMYPETITP